MNYYQNNWSDLIYIVDFAAVALLYNSTRLLSFIVEIGYKPWTSFDWEHLADLINVTDVICKAYTNAVS